MWVINTRRLGRMLVAISTGLLGSSCKHVASNCHRPFLIYSEPIVRSSSLLPRTDGVYVGCENGSVLFFRRDGCFKEYTYLFGREVPSDFPTLDSIFTLRKDYLPDERWGCYAMHYDTLFIQSFNFKPMTGCRRSVFDWRANVMGDSALVVTDVYAHFFGDHFEGMPERYRFVPIAEESLPTDYRPWFERKRWYEEGRHPSRP